MRVLVTGAAGFIGSNTVDLLYDIMHEVVAVDNFSTGKMDNLRLFSNVENIFSADIQNYSLMNDVFKSFRPEAVLHLAAQSAITTAWKDPKTDLNVNTLGTLNLVELSLRYGVSKFVFSSTAAVYGKGRYFASKETDKCEPDTPYGISKLAAEQYIRLMFPNHVILRYANVYGPRQQPIGDNQLIARAFRHFHHGDEFHVVGDGNQKRDFVYVKDICLANYAALMGEQTGTFNVASGYSHSVNEVLREIEKIYSVPGYKWNHTPDQDERGDVYMNGGLLGRALGWKPNSTLKQGIKETADYWAVNGK